MAIHQLPATLYPTTICAIDDDSVFLNTLELRLGEMRRFKLFSSPQEAIHFLTKEYKPHDFIKEVVQSREHENTDQHLLNINIPKIREFAYNQRRFEEISVIILDFSMPGLRGDEVAEALKGLPFEIILLTGEANNEIAVDLFNRHLITNFIRKDRPDMFQKLDEVLTNMQINYFQKKTSMICKSIIEQEQRKDSTQPSCLHDTTFIRHFSKNLAEHWIVEYHLMDTNGSFILLDFDGSPACFLVKKSEHMRMLQKLTETAGPELDSKLKAQIKNRELILHNFDDADKDKPGTWSHLYPATRIPGKTDYFCSYVSTAPSSAIDNTKILSFKDYLSKF